MPNSDNVNNMECMSNDNAKDYAVKRGITWLFSQEFGNVLLACILISIFITAGYAIAYAIPGYEEAHRAERKALHESASSERKELAKEYGRWFDRLATSMQQSQRAGADRSKSDEATAQK